MVEYIKNKDYSALAFFMLWIVLIGWQEMISPAIGITILVLIYELIFVRKFQHHFSTYQFMLVLLFIFYSIGLLWSNHLSVGVKLLEYKMSFFIFPLLFVFRKKQTNYALIFYGVLLGCYALILRLIVGLFLNKSSLGIYEISRQEVFLHPTYLCIYLSLGILLVWYFYFNLKSNLNLVHASLATVVFSYFIISSHSLAGILFLVFIVTSIPGYLLYKKFKYWGLISYIVIIPFLSYFTITNLSFLKYDIEIFESIKNQISEGKEEFLAANKNEISGNKERVVMWFISIEIICENPFGVGLGDIDDAIFQKAIKYDLSVLQKNPLNPHNQFLQIGIDLGFLGIIYLLIVLLVLTYVAIKNKNVILFFAVLSLAFNSLFESVLQRQSGIVFYSFLICLAITLSEMSSEKNKSTAL